MSPVDIKDLDLLLEKVYREGGYDFRGYRRGTVTRRLEKRLHATGRETCQDYIQFLDTHPEEYEKLADCLTIKVSGFFRNSYAFHQVAHLVLPELVSEKRRRKDRSLRVWSTACARGQEPYSIAILIAEFLGCERERFDISIYATDISRTALKEAEAGRYSPKEVNGLPKTILKNYFSHADGHYQATADMKRSIHFSHFDLTSSPQPPFMNLDLIFCCNILIYLQKQLQEHVLDMLYRSLRSQGYLILGESETLPNSLRTKLSCLDTKARIYKKVSVCF
ncbi:MAG: protein-glutamate O-methyltransferase CheR [Syntrophaceae bacterium]|nr:protein-glutamate O-methyltransferase CheR [Syntrophaceae bacterium]